MKMTFQRADYVETALGFLVVLCRPHREGKDTANPLSFRRASVAFPRFEETPLVCAVWYEVLQPFNCRCGKNSPALRRFGEALPA